ncbi:hypothetical protein P378_02955 [Desulforamulus profundi]|uniref:Uncharacterized protein n=1 Tax=Desulforamulus profundi TaxID=1383067 RepID=A0A2C6MGZ0_9FIRM|nr:hypothetical protein P378_02955 [Desulforamulus profundi]
MPVAPAVETKTETNAAVRIYYNIAYTQEASEENNLLPGLCA